MCPWSSPARGSPKDCGGEERKARLNIQESGLIQDWGCRAALGVEHRPLCPQAPAGAGKSRKGSPEWLFQLQSYLWAPPKAGSRTLIRLSPQSPRLPPRCRESSGLEHPPGWRCRISVPRDAQDPPPDAAGVNSRAERGVQSNKHAQKTQTSGS